MNSSEFLQNHIFRSTLFEHLLKQAKSNLLANPEHPAAQYLASRHSLKNAQRFEFGLFPEHPDPKIVSFLRLSYLIETGDPLQPTRLSSFFQHHPLIFPVRDELGYIVGLVGRCILPEEEQKAKKLSKYKNSFFNKSLYLYGLFQTKSLIKETGKVILTEGQIDTQIAQIEGAPAVALSGLDFSPFQAYLLVKYGVKSLYVLLDNDAEGNSAAQQISKRYQDYFQIKVLSVPKGKDIDECVRKFGDSSILKV